MTPRLKELYYKEIQPTLKEQLGFKNTYMGPKLEKVVIEASEQSNRIVVPSIEKPQSLKDFLNNKKIDLIFTDLNSHNNKVNTDKLTENPTCIIIGPEGDFSEKERELILTFKGVQAIKINENILRSETAVISTISIISYCLNL